MLEVISKRSIYKNLLMSMLGFGSVVGIIFPFFTRLMLDTENALSIQFFIMCIIAGLMVGGFNYLIFSLVVSKQIKKIVDGMKTIIERSQDINFLPSECNTFTLNIDSDDYIGKMAKYFNDMSLSVCHRIYIETFVKNLSSKLSRSIDIGEMAKILLEHIMQLTKSDIGVLYGLRDERFVKLSVIGVDETDKIPLVIDESYGVVNLAMHNNQIMEISTDKSGFVWLNISTPFGTLKPEKIQIIPFSIESKVVAIAILISPNIDISNTNKSLVDTLRHTTATYISNAILHDKIKMLAAIDDLTQLLNRRFGIKRLNEEYSRSLRHGIPLSLIMIDIDHFKQINDNFGHDAGDDVLRFVARNLERGLRASDVVCRYGGEEFLIIAPGAGLNDAGKIAERIRVNIERSNIKFKDKELKITISSGIATWPVSKSSNGAELVSDADKALYFAKEHGRNQVILFDGQSFHKNESLH